MSIQGGVHFDLLKRVLRDISRSGQNPEEIIDQVSATVFPMFRVRAASCISHKCYKCYAAKSLFPVKIARDTLDPLLLKVTCTLSSIFRMCRRTLSRT